MSDLTKEFREGMDAETNAPCPYIATSDCADAWWLGRFSTDLRFTADMRCGRVTSGRGDRLNLLVGKSGKTVLRVDWNTPMGGV
jgi:hypothetical protein